MACGLQAGHDEDALHGAPPVVLVGSGHAVHLALAADGVAELLARHAQEDARAHVLEAHHLVALPVDTVALHRPHVQVVALAVLPEGAHLLRTVDRVTLVFTRTVTVEKL